MTADARRRAIAVVRIACCALIFSSHTAAAAERLLSGKQAFAACAACHSLGSQQHKVGPSLAGIVGRKAASLPDYPYSPALRASTLRWTRENLFAWIGNCEAMVPGSWMLYHNELRSEEVIALIEYLETHGQPAADTSP